MDKYCRQCGGNLEPLDDDGFCSDSCAADWDAEMYEDEDEERGRGMTWTELMNRVRIWFPPNADSSSGLLFKMTEELGELAGAYVKEKPRADEEGEAADLLICLILYCNSRGIDLVAAAHAKMVVNESRTGRRNKHGIFVKSQDLT